MEKVLGYTYYDTNLQATDLRPSASHWFGTDNLGRDLFVRVMYGTRYSLIIAISAAAINLVIWRSSRLLWWKSRQHNDENSRCFIFYSNSNICNYFNGCF